MIRRAQNRNFGDRIEDLAQGECGGSMIEFALTFSAMMTFVFVLMEICIAFYTYSMISECARETTRYAIVRGSTCLTASSTSCTASTATINAYPATLKIPNIGGGTMSVNTTFPDGSNVPGNRVNVSISYTMPIKLPFVPTNSLSFSTASQMYILQ